MNGTVLRVYGTPAGQPRPRPRTVGRPCPFCRQRRLVGVYDPDTADAWRAAVAEAAQTLTGRRGERRRLEGGLVCAAVFLYPRPKAHCRTGRYADQLKPTAPVYMAGKPDFDNVWKSTADALNGSAFDDDSSIVADASIHLYAAPGQAPGAAIVLEPLKDRPWHEAIPFALQAAAASL